MEKKSLRQLAKELGVSPSYLSQVKNGKRPPSKKLLSKSETIYDGLQLRLGYLSNDLDRESTLK